MSGVKVSELYSTLEIRGGYKRDFDDAKKQAVELARRAEEAEKALARVALRPALRSEAQQAQRSITEIGAAATGARSDLARVEVPTSARTSAQQTERAVRGISTEAREAASNTRRIDVPSSARTGAQQTERALQGVSRQARQTRDDVEDIGQGGERAGQRIRTGIASGIGSALGGIRSGAESQLGNAGSSGGGAFIASFGTRIASLSSRAGPIGVALAGVAVIGGLAGAKLADAVSDGFKIDSDRRFSAAKFGLTPEQMKQAGQAAGGAYGNAWGESLQANIDTAGVAMQSGLLDKDASAEAIQPLIEKLTIASNLMGTEIPETARAAGQMVKTGLAKDGVEAMDQLVAAQQHGLNISDDLLDTVTEYGTQYRKLGLDGTTALGTISQMLQGGARDADIAADALKEFSIRVVDGSDTTKDAYTSLGLNVEDTTTAFGKGGKAAADMSNTVISKLRDIKDPVERNRIGLELFGTQWEDLGGAINKMDLSKAAGELGQVGGAAQRAGDQMSGPASAIEGAKNRISMASDNIKVKLAEAFAPAATDAANWVGAHADQITEVFMAVVDGAMLAASWTLKIGGAVLKITGTIVEAGATFLNSFITPVLKGFEMIGSAMSHLPGSAGKAGAALRDGARDGIGFIETVGKIGQGMNRAGDGMENLSHGIDNARDRFNGLGQVVTGSKALPTAKQQVDSLAGALNALPREHPITIGTPGGDQALTLLNQLGIKTHVDNNKNIVVDAPLAPAVLSMLEQLGIKVKTDNNKTILVTDNGTAKVTGDLIDQVAQKKRQAWIEVNEYRVQNQGYSYARPGEVGPGLAQPFAQAQGGIRRYADGGISAPPTEATVFPGVGSGKTWRDPSGGLTQAGEDGDAESFIPWASSKRARSTAVLSKTADVFGYSLVRRYAEGGLSPIGQSLWDTVHAKFPDATLNSGYRAGDSGYHGLGQAIDVGGPMQAVADYMMGTYKGQLAQLIWNAGPTLYNVKKNQLGTGVATAEGAEARAIYGEDTMAGHGDHVHLAAEDVITPVGDAAPTAVGPRTIPLVQNPDGTWTSSDPSWAALIKRESGGNPTIVQGIQDANSGGNEASGLFQIAKGTWSGAGGLQYAPTAGEARPEDQAIVAARIFDRDGGSPWGAGLAGREDEAGLRAGIAASTVATPGGAAASTVPTSTGTATGTGVQNVYVTGGKLDGTTSASTDSTTDDRKPAARFGVALYAKGGEVHGTDGNVPGYGTDTVPSMLTPREHVTARPMAIKHRSLLRAIDQDRVAMYAGGGEVGGFGGYTTAGAEYHKAYNLYDLASLGAGVGFAAASGFDDKGAFKGFSTGETSIPGEVGWIDSLKKIAEKPTVKIERAEITAKDPKEMFDKLRRLDPATVELTRNGVKI